MTDHEALALAQFQPLLDLRAAGWQFTPVVADGEVTGLNAVKTWPNSGWADGLMVLSATDVKALRTDPDGGVVWQRTGTLAEIVTDLITLPPPGAPGAPRLVKGSIPTLWTP